ncbi:MAG: hypothetical protein WC587_00385 [Candidatus Paceibacterota bacterium]
MEKIMVLDDSVGNIMLQLSFSNPALIPRWVYHRNVEKYGQHKERKTLNGGVQFIQQTQNVSVADFLSDLKLEGYVLVDASYQERVDSNDHTRRKKYHAVRYIFSRQDGEEINSNIVTELHEICRVAMWRVRAYVNPADVGKNNISINCEVRIPLFYPDGQPITQWQKDEKGKKTGDAPVQLKPTYCIRIKEKNIQLI